MGQPAQPFNPNPSPLAWGMSAPALPSDLPAAAPVRRVGLDFDPARDGFSFPNRFTWTDEDLAVLSRQLRRVVAIAPAAAGALVGGAAAGRRGGLAGLAAGTVAGIAGAADPLVRAVARRYDSFGLCGGMALSAAERWPSAGGTPTADLRAEPLRALLRRRQERTLRASLGDFARWWGRALAARDGLGWQRPLRRELDRIEARLADGRPVVLGLVGDAPDPFSLHQVVAVGIERSGPLDARLDLYDPNAPGTSRSITTAPHGAGRACLTTDVSTGRGADGRARISTRAGQINHLFVVDA